MSVGTVAVVGCGAMGMGIVEVAAKAGLPVTAIKVRGGDPGSILAQLGKSLERQVQKGKLDPDARDRALACVAVSSSLAAVAEADLVIESSVEDLEHKGALLAELERHMTPGAILATNTSSLRLETLAMELTRPAQFVGMHFFNPVPAMPLVEIGVMEHTAPGVAQAARSFATTIGKTPVEMQSSPGYVVNRILVPYLLHAIETLQDGIADAEAIDSAMKLGAAHPMGPLALADFIGLDIVLAMSRSLHAELGESRYRAPSLLRRLVLAGALGRKSGLGLWDYRGEKPVPNPDCIGPKPSLRPAAIDAAE